MPRAIISGVSYSDFWEMTIGEINDVLTVYSEKEQRKVKNMVEIAKAETQTMIESACISAYFGGYYSRRDVNFPRTICDAFPSVFKPQASPENSWQQTYDLLERKRQAFLEKKKRKAETMNGS